MRNCCGDFGSLFLTVASVVNSGGAFGEFSFVVLYRQSDCAFRWARGAVLRGNHKRVEESPTASAVSPPLLRFPPLHAVQLRLTFPYLSLSLFRHCS